MLTKVRADANGPVMWDRERFERFKALVAETRHGLVEMPLDPPKRWPWERRDERVLRYTIPAAIQKLAELEPVFARPETPALPYNEGFEGE